MTDTFELVLIFSSTIIGVVAAAYFYLSTDIFKFMSMLKQPLRLISSGMFIMAIGVLIAAFISYAADQGVRVIFYGFPLEVFFYLLYIIGSLLIIEGARKFSVKAKK